MLLPIISAVSLFTAIFFYLSGFMDHLYMIPAAFIICFLLLLLCWALPCVIYSAFIDLKKPCQKHSPFFRFYANCAVDFLMQLLRIKLHITGSDSLPQEKFLMVGNHRSVMDPILEIGALRGYHIGLVAKKELYKVPVLREIMHKCFCLPLDRASARDAAKTIAQAAEHIKTQKAVMGVYPEGTTSQNLLPFKSGAFKIAKKAKCPIVVTVIRNSEQVLKNAPFRKTHVYLDFIGTLSAEEVEACKTEQLSEKVRSMMEAFLAKTEDE